MRTALLTVFTTLGLTLVASPARAALYAGAVDDPRDPVEASRDILRLESRLDTDAGTWSVTVRLAAAPTASTPVRLTVYRATSADCTGGSTYLYADTQPGGGQTVQQPGGTVPSHAVTRADTDGGATITWAMSSAGLIGSAPCSLTNFRFSFRNIFYDTLPSIIPLTAVASPADAPATTPTLLVAPSDGRGGVITAAPDTTAPPVAPATGPTVPGRTPAPPSATTPGPPRPPASSGPSAPRVLTPLYLGTTSRGAILNFQLDRRPRTLSVTIAGRRARIGRSDAAHLYQPTASRAGLRAGRAYPVVIRATSASGRTLLVHRRLYLHRGFTPTRRLLVAW